MWFARVLVSFVGCSVVAGHAWFFGAFVGAVLYVVRGDAWPMLLSKFFVYVFVCYVAHMYSCSAYAD